MNSQSVKKYYDNNTGFFLKLGQNANSQNIHSALWAEGVDELSVAINYSNELIFQELSKLQSLNKNQTLRVLDLGCGVGSGLFYLANKLTNSTQFYGITISAKQAQIAHDHIRQMQQQHCFIFEGDFQKLDDRIPMVDIAYAIEAFIHSPDADVFFQQISSKLKPGGKLIIIDDVATHSLARYSSKEGFILEEFKKNWMGASLLTEKKIRELAIKHHISLSKNKNLTSYLPLNRPRDIFIRILLKFTKSIFKKNDYFKSLIGGDARQKALLRNLISYQLLIFEKI